MKSLDTYHQILSLAEKLIQTQGYNAFSYKDIAKTIGIKTSSIHYYFPTKADLGKTVLQKHIEALLEALNPIMNNNKLNSRKKMEFFINAIFSKTYYDNKKMCLGGMLASDILTLPDLIQREVADFFHQIELWLTDLMNQAIVKKEFSITKKDIKTEAKLILSLIEGSLLLARLFEDEGYLESARKQILSRLTKD